MFYERKKGILSTIIISCLLFSIFCSIPQMLFSQKDIENSEVGSKEMKKKVLVASQSSEFKNAIIEKLKDSFSSDSIFVKFVGLNSLEEDSPDNYSAVVIINTCIAWRMNSKVEDFVNRYKDCENIIILITSGDGDWLPEKKDRKFDAISSASEMKKVDDIVDEIIKQVHSRI